MPRRTRTRLIIQRKVRSTVPAPRPDAPEQERRTDGEHATACAQTVGAL